MIELYLGATFAGWARDGQVKGWARHDAVLDALARWSDEIVERHSTRWRKPSVALWLSGGLARPFLCGPVEGLTNWREAEAVACAMAPDSTGFEGACQVALEAWPGAASVLATAVSAALSERIGELARTRRIFWRSVRPRWAGALDEALRQQPGLRLMAFEEPDSVTVLGGASAVNAPRSEPAFDYAVTYAPAPQSVEFLAMWDRTLLSRDVSTEDARFARLDAGAPGNMPTDARAGEAEQAIVSKTLSWPAAIWDGEDRQP